MRSVKFIDAAGAASLLSSAAFAADMAIAPPPPMYAPPPVRGFRRLVSARRYRLQQSAGRAPEQRARYRRQHLVGSEPRLRHRRHLRPRRRLPVQQLVPRRRHRRISRQRVNFNGTDFITFIPVAASAPTPITATKSEWVGSRQRLCRSRHLVVRDAVHRRRRRCARESRSTASPTQRHSPTAVGGALPGLAFGDNASKWNFAWALHAGVAYKVTPNFTVELAYSYLDMGDGMTGDLRSSTAPTTSATRRPSRDITSHDLKLGVRWNLDQPRRSMQPPLIRKG